jgi:hypothetical protein
MRGKDARIHTKVNAIAIVIAIRVLFDIIKYPENRVALRRLIIKIFAYSAIKISAKVALLYSVLNPETSSDSPSAKSKGVRFVSARLVIYHKTVIGKIRSISQDVIFIFIVVKFIQW